MGAKAVWKPFFCTQDQSSNTETTINLTQSNTMCDCFLHTNSHNNQYVRGFHCHSLVTLIQFSQQFYCDSQQKQHNKDWRSYCVGLRHCFEEQQPTQQLYNTE